MKISIEIIKIRTPKNKRKKMKRSNFLIVFLFILISSQSWSISITKGLPQNAIPIKDSTDSKSYIDFVNQFYFQNTDEIYINIYFKQDSIDDKEYLNLVNTKDSIISEDDENRRNRIPAEVAQKIFDYSGLDTIYLFDDKHTFLTKAYYVRTEYLEQNISPDFIAVFRPEDPKLAKQSLYCISNPMQKMIISDFVVAEDSNLTKKILREMNFNYKYDLRGQHYFSKETGNYLSFINFDSTSAIIEIVNNQYQCLYLGNSEIITDIVFIPIIKNKHHVLLIKSVLPDSDLMWSSLLEFNGQNYVYLKRQRISNYK